MSLIGSTALLLVLGILFSFPNPTLCRTLRSGDQPVTRPLPTHRTTLTQNERTQTYVSPMEFEPTISVLERSKTVRALDRAATVIGFKFHNSLF
jgi:hypothetical protein